MFLTQDLTTQIERALNDPLNEPLDWLLGDALRSHTAWPKSPHLILSELVRPRTSTLAFWNAMISEFRHLLNNAQHAPQKAKKDVSSSGDDANNKLEAMAAEILAVLELSERGFSEFEVVPVSSRPNAGFPS